MSKWFIATGMTADDALMHAKKRKATSYSSGATTGYGHVFYFTVDEGTKSPYIYYAVGRINDNGMSITHFRRNTKTKAVEKVPGDNSNMSDSDFNTAEEYLANAKKILGSAFKSIDGSTYNAYMKQRTGVAGRVSKKKR